MKIYSVLPLAAVAAVISLAPFAFAETGGFADPKFEQKLDALWNCAVKTYYSPKTNLFYTAPVDKMPSPEEIAEYKPFKKNGEPNYMGGHTGIEDCSMLCGIILVGLCDKYELTGDAETAEWARRIARGLLRANRARRPGLCRARRVAGGRQKRLSRNFARPVHAQHPRVVDVLPFKNRKRF